ncbi:class A beta-lactamase-related serine hydrolase [bacterium]|nr:MAG: class A beta-lactamase-related serine hydrolase [bacterium]
MRPILDSAIAARAFPGAVVHFSRRDEVVYYEAAGRLGYEEPFDAPVVLDTLYDLASLTKIYTLATALLAFRKAKVPLETPLQIFFPQFDSRITLELLMAHASGIEIPIQRLEKVEAKDWISRIAEVALVSQPGTSVLYSCTNYFLLARAVEEVVGDSFDSYFEARVKAPLQIQNTFFNPPSDEVAPTEEHDTGVWRGVVHDEAARSWRQQTGSCSGNAGLFADAADVARFLKIWVKDGPELLHPSDVSRALSTRYRERTCWRGLGFQIDAPFYMSESAPRGTAGHLGFTGPSLALHSESARIAVILNNRVHPTRSGPERLTWHRQMTAKFFASTAT